MTDAGLGRDDLGFLLAKATQQWNDLLADRFAAAGYAVLVPDLFWRIEPGMEIAYNEAGLKRGSEIVAQFDMDQGVEDLGEAVKALRERPECSGKAFLAFAFEEPRHRRQPQDD